MATLTLLLAGLDTEIVALVAGKLDLGTGPNATARIVDGAGATLVDIPLQDPAYAVLAGSEPLHELQGVPLTAAATGAGTAAKCILLNKDGNPVLEGPASEIGGGGFAQLDIIQMAIGDPVNILSLNLTFPAAAA